jgi:hypothetical protein
MMLCRWPSLGLPRPKTKRCCSLLKNKSVFCRDFGHLVFVKGIGAGVLYLRMLPSTQDAVHHELERVIQMYPRAELEKAFVVIEPAGHRIRRPLD